MQIIQGKWKIPHAARKPLVFFLVLLFLSIQFRFLFSDSVPDSVSLQNQYLIAQDYQILFKNFLSSGYDRSLYGGSPTFYFQSPFFFFLVSFLHTFFLFFLPFSFAFNLGILLTLFLFSYSFLKLGFLFLTETNLSPGNALLAMTGLMFYFLYPGDRVVGAGVVGVFQNSISSVLGLGFAILAIYYLEKFRYTGKISSFAKNLITGSLVFYTHYEMSLFYVISLGIYFLFYKDEFEFLEILLILLMPILVALPVLWNYFAYVPFQQNPPVSFPINGLLSLLGEEFSSAVARPEKFLDVLKQILIDQYWIHLLFPILFVIGIRLLFIRKLLPPISRFLIFGTLLFYWMATDSSLSLIFPWLHVKWYTALNVSLVFLTFAALVTARFFLKNLPPGRWKLWTGLILFVLGMYRFIITIPGPSTGIENISKTPSSIWSQKEEWTRILKETPYSSLIASEEIAGGISSLDSRWASVLVRQSVRRNVVLQNRFENSLPSSPEEIIQLFPSQGPKSSLVTYGKRANLRPVQERDKLSDLFLSLLQERGVTHLLLKSEALNQFASNLPVSFIQIAKRGEWILWKLNITKPPLELLSAKPWALVTDDAGQERRTSIRSEDLSESALHSLFELSITLVPITAAEYKADENSFSGAFPFSQLKAELQKLVTIQEEEKAKNKPKGKFDSEKEKNPSGTQIHPFSWDDSRILWELPAVPGENVCSPVLIRSGYFPLWKSENGEKSYRTLEGQFYFCSKLKKNEFVFYDIRSYLITFLQLLLPLLFFGATFLNRRKLSN
ncbi:hypothetical protein A0128_06760 [Leptospira tipperaryensis]|uniref:Membrane protein 6-pyruvoyl-tetrahydropterin synthase-related domain-containing protein n=1 Tax=Leptospira tipperaryensis TaxID=2564040 RepID=A0A1D7UVE0_9LEPT|nr:hypothetical protein [Leptospira tipperaryensis]AOP33575.1 hypothetical protein A0128_06760 [Leptospira tipperaryensis]